MDKIFIRDLKADVIVGYYVRESHAPQPLLLDIEMALPNPAVFKSDRLHDTINYAAVVARVREELAATHFRLLEALAEHLAQMILREFATPWVKLSIAKLGIVPGVRQLGVVIEREGNTMPLSVSAM